MATADVNLAAQECAADTDVIARSFMRYVETFQGLDPHATIRHLHVPFVFVDERMRVSSTKPELEAFVAMFMRDLASRAYGRSEIDELYVHRLSDHAAVVSCSRTRYTEHGDEMGRLGETYTLLRGPGEWRIAVAIVHGADRVLHGRENLQGARPWNRSTPQSSTTAPPAP